MILLILIKKNKTNGNFEALSGKKIVGEISTEFWNFKKKRNQSDFISNKSTSIDGTELYIKNLYVENEYRNRGIGTMLMNKVILEASSKGSKTILLYVENHLDNVKRLYRKLGFRKVGSFGGKIKKPRYLIMRKIIKEN
jgi:ribosomal protein S18 acetylase RimI-like enzyme